jgi:radical S-adenosyl methionine domain-containing protein 2
MVLPPTINWHLEPRCNYGCKFCFATFEDVKQDLAGSLWTPNTAASPNGTAAISSQLPPWSDPQQLLRVPQLLHAAGASKINFVGEHSIEVPGR